MNHGKILIHKTVHANIHTKDVKMKHVIHAAITHGVSLSSTPFAKMNVRQEKKKNADVKMFMIDVKKKHVQIAVTFLTKLFHEPTVLIRERNASGRE